jgi:hypothetical protein
LDIKGELNISQIDCAFSSPSGDDIRRARPQSAASAPIVGRALAAVEAPIFRGGPVSLIAPGLIVGLGPLGRKTCHALPKSARAWSKWARFQPYTRRARYPDRSRSAIATEGRRWGCRRCA